MELNDYFDNLLEHSNASKNDMRDKSNYLWLFYWIFDFWPDINWKI
jgi:hypothetical protein